MNPRIAMTGLGAVSVPLSLFLATQLLRPPQDPAPAGPVTATEFRLLRPDGTLCGVWTASEKTASLDLADQHGQTRLRLITTEDGLAGVVLLDGEGKLRSAWSTNAGGESVFATYGEGQVPRIELSTSAKDAASLVVRDAKGRRRSFTGILECGASAFSLFDPEDRVVAAMTTPLTGETYNPAVVLYDHRLGTMRAAMSIAENGEPSFSLHGPKEQMRSTWSLAGDGGGLAWFDDQFRMQSVFGNAPDGTAGMLVFDPAGNVLHRAPDNFDVDRAAPGASRAPRRAGGAGGAGGDGQRRRR